MSRPFLIERGRLLAELPGLVLAMAENPDGIDRVIEDVAGESNLPEQVDAERWDGCE